ncbi:hypothetical protein B0H21DRAFT_823599 [Amylocystis lapponica]|nr:hypothetical protein B0H21DRAFT_823599 [Amylocystis lapponica]
MALVPVRRDEPGASVSPAYWSEEAAGPTPTGQCVLDEPPKIKPFTNFGQTAIPHPQFPRRLGYKIGPINSIPTETLAHIFGCTLDDDDGDEFVRYPEDHYYEVCERAQDITDLMLVCKTWQNTILTFPSLWSRVTVGPKTTPRTMPPPFTRSKAALIKVYMLGESSEMLAFLDKHSRRLKAFHLEVPKGNDLTLVEKLRSPAPFLESLSLSFSYIGEANPKDGKLPLVFGGHMPRLTRLTLSPYRFTPSNGIRNLTHLRISDTVDLEQYYLSDLLDMLEANPNLEELDMHAASPALEDQRGVSRDVELPRLYIFSLSYHNWDQLRHIFWHLIIPKTTNLIIHDVLEDAGENVAAVFPPDASRIKNLSTITQISITHVYNYVDFVGVSDDRLSSFIQATSTRHFALEDEADVPYHNSTWLTLGHVIPLGQLRSIWVDTLLDKLSAAHVSIPVPVWNQVLPQLNALELLAIRGPATDNILTALLLLNGTTLRCPRLRSLSIYHDSQFSFMLLFNVLAMRLTHGSPLLELNVFVKEEEPPTKRKQELEILRAAQGTRVTLVYGAGVRYKPCIPPPLVCETEAGARYHPEFFHANQEFSSSSSSSPS